MNKNIALVCILVWSNACAGSDAPAILATQEMRASVVPEISNIVGDILSHPNQYSGQQVEIVGFFRGWDLLHETQQAPPSRSDWVIADLSGPSMSAAQFPPGLTQPRWQTREPRFVYLQL